MSRRAPVAAVLPAWRSRPWIREALGSVFAQVLPPAEIVVVDDGSDDGLEEEIEDLLDRILFLRQENRGPGAARNLAVAMTSSPFLAFLDADDLWEPERLAVQVPLLEADPARVLVCSDAWEFGEGRELRRWSRSGGRRSPPALDLEGLLRGNGIATLTVLCRREAFERAGGFDEDRGLLAVEDYDLWLRMSELGGFLYVDRPLARYRRRPSSLSGARRFREGVRLVLEKFRRRSERAVELRHLLARREALLWLDEAREIQDAGQFRASLKPIRRAWSLAPGAPETWRTFFRGLMLGISGLRPGARARDSGSA